jgi:two-component system phosphate regulon sensor histidine kinase PhoR
LPDSNYRLHILPRLALVALAGLLPGLLFGHAGWFVAAAFAIYLGWTMRQLVRLHEWVNQEAPGDPPDSIGLWGGIFDRIHRLRRREMRVREELQNTLDRARDSVSSLKDAVVVVDAGGQLEWWNPAAQTLLGLRWPGDHDQPLVNLVRDPAFRRWFDAGDYTRLLDMNAPNNDNVHLQCQVTVFGNGDRLLIARDVTRLQQLEQTRRDFVANVSHELKTPLTVLRGYVETFLDSADALPPRLARAMTQMQQQATRMERLIHDLLLLSRLESTPPARDGETVHVRSLLEGIHADVLETSRDKQHNITLRVDDDVRLLGDDTELQSAFSNILVNAARYSEPNGDIDIHWWVDAKGAHLSIRDKGPGIEAHHIPRLTERFYRTDTSRSIATGGTGLGLAIVKHVLKRHDAKLEIHSQPGKGSTFICHFPRERVLPGVSA